MDRENDTASMASSSSRISDMADLDLNAHDNNNDVDNFNDDELEYVPLAAGIYDGGYTHDYDYEHEYALLAVPAADPERMVLLADSLTGIGNLNEDENDDEDDDDDGISQRTCSNHTNPDLSESDASVDSVHHRQTNSNSSAQNSTQEDLILSHAVTAIVLSKSTHLPLTLPPSAQKKLLKTILPFDIFTDALSWSISHNLTAGYSTITWEWDVNAGNIRTLTQLSHYAKEYLSCVVDDLKGCRDLEVEVEEGMEVEGISFDFEMCCFVKGMDAEDEDKDGEGAGGVSVTVAERMRDYE